MFRHTKNKKNAIINGGVVAGSVFATATAAAAIASAPALAIGFAAAAGGAGGIAIYGYFAREVLPRFTRLEIRNASPADIEELHANLLEYNPNIVPIEERLLIWKKNRACFQVIEDHKGNGEKAALEIFAIYPLKKKITERILKGTATGGNVRAADICRTFWRASSLYVGFAEGNSLTSRGLILAEIESIVTRMRNRPVFIATIPTRKEALRTVQNNGFNRLDGDPPTLNDIAILRVN